MKATLKAFLCSSNSLSPPLIFVLFCRGFVGESDQIQFWTDIRSDKVEDIEHSAWGEVFGRAGRYIVDIAAMILVIMAMCAGLLEFCGHLSTISSGGNFGRDQSGREGCPQSESGCLPVGVVECASCSGYCLKLMNWRFKDMRSSENITFLVRGANFLVILQW